jgi:DNA repair exonuclease SbcCD nuclease subunit
MKCLIFSDIHWNTYSSIIRKRGKTYSERLEHLINSMNWLNEEAIKHECSFMICCGDFFDQAKLNDEEITALKEIRWNNLPCYFVCGNHESSVLDLKFSSLKSLESVEPKHIIITKPTSIEFSESNSKVEFRFLPYIAESERQDLTAYFKPTKASKVILCTHEDIQGIQYGGWESKIGFTKEELEASADLVLNGHLHNSEWVTNKILNVGSSLAHNFTNDSSRYNYGVWVLDTDTLKLEFIENPYSFNFYNFDILEKSDFAFAYFYTLKQNAIISVRTTPELVDSIKQLLEDQKDKILESRLLLVNTTSDDQTEVTIAELQTDHLQKLVEFCKANITNSSILEQELTEICK